MRGEAQSGHEFIRIREPEAPACRLHAGRQRLLVNQIVAHHPILPKLRDGIGEQRQPREQARAAAGGIKRGGIKGGPAAALYPGFHPTVRIGGTNHLPASHGIEDAALKTG